MIWLAFALGLMPSSTLHAQSPTIDDLKGKIFDARMASQTFVNGLKFCDELDGKGFYFQLRNRVLLLDEYFQSLENLVKAQVYNPQKKRPWTLEDAKERWEEVKKQAKEDRARCELVKSLPQLEKQLQELEAKNAGPDKNAGTEKKE
jgi:tRNA nucleotidyltransferase/poly(A) polymerase